METKRGTIRCVKYWEIIAGNLSKAGWTWGCVSGVDSNGTNNLRCGRPLWRWSTLHCARGRRDRKSTRLNSSHPSISYAVFCLKKKKRERHLLSTSRKTGDLSWQRYETCEL